MKPVRKSVRTFLIEDNKVLTIKYTTDDYKHDYYDVPGGKIEEGETGADTAIREFKEETEMEIMNPEYRGNLIIEYPERVYDLKIYTAREYKGTPKETEESIAEWMDIDELLQEDKKIIELYLLDENHRADLFNKTDSKWHFLADSNNNKVGEITYKSEEEFWSEHNN